MSDGNLWDCPCEHCSLWREALRAGGRFAIARYNGATTEEIDEMSRSLPPDVRRLVLAIDDHITNELPDAAEVSDAMVQALSALGADESKVN